MIFISSICSFLIYLSFSFFSERFSKVSFFLDVGAHGCWLLMVGFFSCCISFFSVVFVYTLNYHRFYTSTQKNTFTQSFRISECLHEIRIRFGGLLVNENFSTLHILRSRSLSTHMFLCLCACLFLFSIEFFLF